MNGKRGGGPGHGDPNQDYIRGRPLSIINSRIIVPLRAGYIVLSELEDNDDAFVPDMDEVNTGYLGDEMGRIHSQL